MKKALTSGSAKKESQVQKQFPKKTPMLEITSELNRSNATIMAVALGSFILLNTCDSKGAKEVKRSEKKGIVTIQNTDKECSLDLGDYALEEYGSVHFKDDFPGEDVPLRFNEHSYWKLELVDDGYGSNLKKLRLTKQEFEDLKDGAKEVFQGPVDVEGAKIVYMDQGPIESVVCKSEHHKKSWYEGYFAGFITTGATAIIAYCIFAIWFRRKVIALFKYWQKQKSIEAKKHSKEKEKKHSED